MPDAPGRPDAGAGLSVTPDLMRDRQDIQVKVYFDRYKNLSN